jgi:hypothetical protein
MKLTWREHPDGSWHARHYPSGDTDWLVPFSLSVEEQEGTFPWYWQIERMGEVLRTGQSTDLESARLSAHGQLARHTARTMSSVFAG